ncbi:uncharacterized protein CIMG_09950 [Coccidioides immitis RS]|uniref:Protein kinase domain-containing protein n=1 Tax=Coccidioides immitis (strain RS) TaxID=246410 RepID=J3K0H1_COCIM|nr:uncharacterized protein CIMG_09950 [Coccidioides immitis RS]EAS27345.3 hypothetical protein CIMG_09950 [Coccidioides immitis RS]
MTVLAVLPEPTISPLPGSWKYDLLVFIIAMKIYPTTNRSWLSFSRYPTPFCRPPEEFFNKPITISKVADIWTLEVVLYNADMGWGEMLETCQWNVAAGEFKALEDMLRSIMMFELTERPTVKQLLELKYIVKWAMPAWERQVEWKSALTKTLISP